MAKQQRTNTPVALMSAPVPTRRRKCSARHWPTSRLNKPLTHGRLAQLVELDWTGYQMKVSYAPHFYRLEDGPPPPELWIRVLDPERVPDDVKEYWYTSPMDGTAKVGDTVIVADAERRIRVLLYEKDCLRDEWTSERIALNDMALLGFSSCCISRFR